MSLGDFHLGLLISSLFLLLLLLPCEQLHLPRLLGVNGGRNVADFSLSFLGALACKVVDLLTVE